MTMPAPSLRAHWPLWIAAALCLLSLALFWPGIATYDAVAQYQQVVSGQYDDWHPPVMARLWSLLARGWPGTPPMLLLQLAGYWLGLGLIAHALGGRRAAMILLIGLCPPLLGWQGVIVKDSQMVAALVAATGLVGHYRLHGRRIPRAALLIVILYIGYATLIRANAAFSTVPLAILLAPRRWSPLARLGAILAGIAIVLALSQPINLHLLGAQDSGVRRSEPTYDLAAIAVRTGDAQATGIAPDAIAILAAHHCVKPLFWDSLGGQPACATALAPLADRPVGQLYRDLASAAIRHPIAYLAHRFAHLNSTARWLVAARWPLATPPAKAEPNDLGLRDPPCCAAARWQRLAGLVDDAPIGWPIIWTMAAAWGLWIGRLMPPHPRHGLGIALFGSALVQEASFAAISVSSDLRYHLWPMLATAIGWTLIWGRPGSGRQWRTAALLIACIAASGLAARIILPAPPSRYADLLL